MLATLNDDDLGDDSNFAGNLLQASDSWHCKTPETQRICNRCLSLAIEHNRCGQENSTNN